MKKNLGSFWELKLLRECKMILKKVSLLIPYNNNFEIILQKRRGFIDKPTDRDYGFFGGHLEYGENFEQALAREIKEELTIDIKDIKSLIFFRKYEYEIKDIKRELYVFLCKIRDVIKMKVNEGKPITIKLNKALNSNISSMDKQILQDVYEYINKK